MKSFQPISHCNAAADICAALGGLLSQYLHTNQAAGLSEQSCLSQLRSLVSAGPDGPRLQTPPAWPKAIAQTPVMRLVGALSHCYAAPVGFCFSAISGAYCSRQVRLHPAKFARLAEQVWGISPLGKTEQSLARLGVDCLREWLLSLGAPVSLYALGVSDDLAFPALIRRCGGEAAGELEALLYCAI